MVFEFRSWLRSCMTGRRGTPGEHTQFRRRCGFACTWATDLGSDLTADVLHQFFELWTAMDTVQLDQDSTDKVVWSWECDGEFSARSAYAAKFWGQEVVPTADFTWTVEV